MKILKVAREYTSYIQRSPHEAMDIFLNGNFSDQEKNGMIYSKYYVWGRGGQDLSTKNSTTGKAVLQK